MATYADFLIQARNRVGDYPKRRYETADGDGASSLFILKHPKILENSYVYKTGVDPQTPQSGGTIQAEGVDFTHDLNSAEVIFSASKIPAIGNNNISFSYKSVKETDTNMITIINTILGQLTKKLWIEEVNDMSLSTTQGYDYSLSAVGSNIVSVIEAEYRTSPSSSYQSIASNSGLKFIRDLQVLRLTNPFINAGYEIRLRILREFILGNAVDDTFEPDEKYWAMLQEFYAAQYLRRRAFEKIDETGATSKEYTFLPTTELLREAKRIEDTAQDMLRRIRPNKPAITIPYALDGVRR